MDMQSYLPAGNVAYGLAVNYIANYLKLVLPGMTAIYSVHSFKLFLMLTKKANHLMSSNSHPSATTNLASQMKGGGSTKPTRTSYNFDKT